LRASSAVVATKDLDRKLMAVPEHYKDHTESGDLIDEILSALLYQNPATARYARPQGPVRTYKLRPLTLATYRQSLYLVAVDDDEDKIKTFALDRFRSFKRKRKERFDYPTDFDPRSLIADCFGITGGSVVNVELAFGPREAPYIRERVYHHTQTVEPGPEEGVILKMQVGMSTELVRWVLSFGPEVRVLAPESLAEEIRKLHLEAATGQAGEAAVPAE
jgi:predicted DNA-binding transcriptional regulator YafY